MHSPSKGQMSLIMILIVALALVFYAVAVNWSRIASTKASVTIASNTGASKLVSMMASYGEYVLQTQLGGRVSKCSGTSLIVTIIVLIILVIVCIVVAVFSYGVGGWVVAGLSATMLITVLVIAAVVTLASMILSMTMIEPGLTKMWNKAQQAITNTEDQFLEQSLSTAIQAIISDPVRVADRWDADMDGRWWVPELNGGRGGGNTRTETISRYGYYYTDRMKSLMVSKDNMKVKKLREMLLKVNTDLGLYSTSSVSTEVPAVCYSAPDVLKPECDKCCVERIIRPVGCDPDTRTQAEIDGGVEAWTTYPVIHAGCGGENVYDPLYELKANRSNPPINFFEMMGQDDGNPNDSVPVGFTGAHSTVGSIFRVLWDLADSSPDIVPIAPGLLPTAADCHWCTPAATGGACTPAAAVPPLYRSADMPVAQLNLPACSGANCCINRFASNPDAGREADVLPLGMDKVGTITAFAPLPTDPAGCGDDITNPPLWKRGADYQQATFVDGATGTPYPIKMQDTAAIGSLVGSCAGTNVDTCRCSDPSMPAANQALWHDDAFDAIPLGFMSYKTATDFVTRVNTGVERVQLASNPTSWGYLLIGTPEIPPSPPAYAGDPGDPGSPATEGELHKLNTWIKDMNAWSLAINQWLDGPYADDTMWCLPANQGLVSAGELSAITNNGTVPWGSLDSVINCLNYNAANEAAFQNCRAEMTAFPHPSRAGRFYCSGCRDVHRSALAGFDAVNDPNKCEAVVDACVAPTWLSCSTGIVNGGVHVIPHPTCDDQALDSCTAAMECFRSAAAACPASLWVEAYRQNIIRSIPLAAAQAPKFTKRAAYLTKLKEKAMGVKTILDSTLYSMNHVLDPFTGADLGIAVIDNPPGAWALSGALPDLINDIIDDSGDEDRVALGNKIIYGWVSPKPKSWGERGRQYGYLHIVKVEATLPNRNRGQYDIGIDTCGNNGHGSTRHRNLNQDRLPWVHTYSKSWGTKRCYEMKSTAGCVGVRVIRYDEDHDPAQNGITRLLSSLPITYHNPHVKDSEGVSSADIASQTIPCAPGDPGYPNCDIFEYCFKRHFTKRWKNPEQPEEGAYWPELVLVDPSIYPTAGGFIDVSNELQKGFMINLPILLPSWSDATPPPELTACLAAAEKRLSRGMFSETCAKYYIRGGNYAMGFRRCSECCASPNN